MSHYTYGDSALAAERLALIAMTFEPVSRAFIEEAAPRRPRLAVDLGCGPGDTTRLLSEVTGALKTVGLDSSASYISLAETSAPPHVDFKQHDASVVPFPVSTIDVVYARLLLAHLSDPIKHVGDWMKALSLRNRFDGGERQNDRPRVPAPNNFMSRRPPGSGTSSRTTFRLP